MTTSEMIDLSVKRQMAFHNGDTFTPEMRVLTNLSNACDDFSRTCFHDIRKIHKAEKKERGLSATYVKYKKDKEGNKTEEIAYTIKVLTFVVAGRILVTLKNEKDESVTICGGEDDQDAIGGLHGIDCDNPDTALDMLTIMSYNWYSLYDKRGANDTNLFEVDKQVKIAGT